MSLAVPQTPPATMPREQLRFGRVWVDVLDRRGALAALKVLVAARRGGSVFTPNVDHVVLAESHPEFRRTYRRASLSLADGKPLMWAAPMLGRTLPEKLSGSDMIRPIAQLAAEMRWRVYFLGGSPGAAQKAADQLASDYGLIVAGVDDAMIRLDDAAGMATVAERVRATSPDLVFVALGAPKQELFIGRMHEALAPAVSIGVGASLDFIAGTLRRSPKWMSDIGVEWLYRLAQEPRRLWRRYLVQDPKFLAIVYRTWRLPTAQRLRWR